jgi:hypothetical protein
MDNSIAGTATQNRFRSLLRSNQGFQLPQRPLLIIDLR